MTAGLRCPPGRAGCARSGQRHDNRRLAGEAHTALAAKRFGASDERLAALWHFRAAALFTAAEKAAFAFALAASSVPNAVDAAIGGELRRYWNDDEIVEILAVVALFGFLNRWNDSMATALEAPAAGAAAAHLAAHGWQAGKHGA